jgi:hypothetical protein
MKNNTLKKYYKAVNAMVEELLKKEGYETCWQTYSCKYLTDCDISNGTEFIASDGSFDNKVINGNWIGGDIGGVLCINEQYFLIPDIIKEALEIEANLDDIFVYLDYELDCHEKKVDKQFNFKSYIKLGEENRNKLLLT